jgi:hypothetical protein
MLEGGPEVAWLNVMRSMVLPLITPPWAPGWNIFIRVTRSSACVAAA